MFLNGLHTFIALFVLAACNGVGGDPIPNSGTPDLSGGATSITAPAVNYTADGSTIVPVMISLVDGSGAPIIAVVPTFVADEARPGTNSYGACSATDSTGTSYCTMTSTSSGLKNFTLTSPQIVAGGTVNFIADVATELFIQAQPGTVQVVGVDFPEQFEVHIRDVFTNIVEWSTDQVAIEMHDNATCTSPSGGTLNAAVNPITYDGVTGMANFSSMNFTLNGFHYFRIYSPTNAGLPESCIGAIDFNTGIVESFAFDTEPSAAAIAGVDFATQPIVSVRDQFNNLVNSGVNITLDAYLDAGCTTTPAGGVLNGVATQTAIAGTASGWSFDYQTAETIYLRATGPGVNNGCSAAIVVSPNIADAGNSNIVGTGPHVANNTDASTITVTLADVYGNLIPGETPTFDAAPGGNTYNSCSASNALGVSTCTMTSGLAGIKTLSIQTPVVDTGGTVDFQANPDAGNSSIAGTGPVIADGISTSTITIYLRDVSNNPVIGIIPTFTATDTGATNVYTACSATDGTGLSTCTMTSTAAEVKTLSLAWPIVFAGGTVTFDNDVANAANSTITGTGPVTADGVGTSTITITLNDAFNNPVDGVTPTFNATDTGTTNVYNACSVTNASGVATCTMTSTRAEVKTLSTQTPIVDTGGTVTFEAGALANLTYLVQPSSVTTAGAPFAVQPIVELSDAFGNIRTSSTEAITLSAYTDALCTVAAGGVLSATLNPQNADGVTGRATFAGVNYNTTEFIYIKAANGAIEVCSNSIDVQFAAAAQLAFVVEPTDAVSTNIISPNIEVQIQDSFGNAVTTATNAITLSIQTDPSVGATLSGTLTQNGSNITSSTGIASFGDISIDKVGTGFILEATSGGLTAATSTTFNITEGAPVDLFIAQEPTDTSSGAVIGPDISIEIHDAGGNVVTSATDQVTLAFDNDPTAGTAVISGNILNKAAVAGVVTFDDVSIDVADLDYSFAFTASGLTTASSASFNITAGPPTQLRMVQQPTDTSALTAISPDIIVEVLDANNNVVQSAGTSITLVINNDLSGSASLGGTLTQVTNGVGAATFNDITIDNAGTGYTLDATSGALTPVTTDPFDINVGLPSQVVITQQPATTLTAGTTFASIIAEIRDAGGNIVSTATDNVTIAFNNDPTAGLGTLGGTLTKAAVAGVVTFDDITYDLTGTGFTFDLTSGALTPATTIAFDITHNIANALFFTQEPTMALAGANIAPAITVEIRDAFGNVCDTNTDLITLTFNNDPTGGSATLSGDVDVNAISGLATFSDINIDMIGTPYSLNATAGGITTAVSANFDIDAGAASKVVFIVHPVDTTAGVNISPLIQVQVQDALNNPILSAGTSVDIAFGADPSGTTATLGGTLTQLTDASGIATFNDINIDKAFNSYSLQASSGALTTDTSSTFNITAAAATKLAFSAGPTDVASGAAIAPAIQVSLLDTFDNIANTQTDNITLAFNTDPSGSATLGGTLTVAAIAGVATFNDITVDNVDTNYDLQATSGALTSATSGTFNVTPGATSKVVFSIQPVNATSMTSISPSFTVELQDANDNVVTTDNTTSIDLNIQTDPSVGASLFGTTSRTVLSGVATFDDIQIDKIGTGFVLRASSGALVTDDSTAFNITVGAPALLAFQAGAEPSDTIVSTNMSPAVAVEVHDAGGNLVSTAADNVSLSIATDPVGGSVISGGGATAASAGVATFSSVQIDQVGTGFEITASSGGLTSVTSSAFNITGGTPTQLVITQEPTNTNVNTNITPSITVELREAGGNLSTGATDNVTLAFGKDPTAGTANIGGTVTRAAVGGIATFNDIQIDTEAVGYTFTFTSGALTPDTSTTFNIEDPPTITGFVEPVDGTYALAGEILFQVNFSEAITVGGSPRIAFDVGGVTRYANYNSGDGTTGLEFRYQVQTGDNDVDGISIASAVIDLNSGSLQDSVGLNAPLNFSAFLGSLTSVLVDTSGGTTAPDQVTGVTTAPTSVNTSLNVSWNVPNDNGTAITNYVVQYREDGTSTWLNKSPSPTSNFTTITGLTTGTTYNIRVAASNGVLGAFSAVVDVEIFDISSLSPIAWLDANDVTGTGSNPSNGTKVATWSDLSGVGSDATEGTPANQPTFQTNVQNSLPAVRFDDHNRGLEGIFTRSNGTSLTIVVVGQFDSGYSDRCMFEFRKGGARAFFIDQRYAGNTNYSPALTKNQFNLFVIENTGGTASVTENGTEIFNGAIDFNTDFTGTGTYVLGDDQTGNNRMFGYIGEFLIFDSALSASDLTKLEAYLKNKWGTP